ncbi:MAG: NAD(P)/FAD-dependent oxidoreductase [Bacteroidetes bacterium]|nr:MAG: NAD(P)/FAD-dependent oxidoreductase [Bacteroidota bacterium]
MKALLPMTNRPRVLIIGGGYAGIMLAKGLRNSPFQVVMVDRHNYHAFQPLYYQVATGGLEPDSIAFPLRKMFARQENYVFRIAEVQQIDTENKTAHTSIGEISYDYLVIATGAVTNFFGMKEVEANGMSMKSIPEALDLRSLILQNFEQALQEVAEGRDSLMKFVIVGGGPTGVETAGALAELKRHVLPNDYPELDLRQMEIHLIESGDRLLGGMSEKSSADARKALEDLGVHIWLDTRVTGFDGKLITTAGGEDFYASTLIWAAGIKGALPEGMPTESVGRGNRLQVDQYNLVKGHEHIYAIGDIALMAGGDAKYPNGHPQVAQVAIQMGKTLSKNLIRLHNGAPLEGFSYQDPGSMATIGRNKAVADFPQGLHLKGLIAWLAWMFVHLLFLIGGRNKLVVFVNWVWSYFTYDKGTRLIIRPFKRKKVAEPAAQGV